MALPTLSPPAKEPAQLIRGWSRAVYVCLGITFAIQGAFLMWGLPSPAPLLVAVAVALALAFGAVAAREAGGQAAERDPRATAGFLAVLTLNAASLALGAPALWGLCVGVFAFVFGGGVLVPVGLLAVGAVLTWAAVGVTYHYRPPPTSTGAWILALGAVATLFAFAMSRYARRLQSDLEQMRLRGVLERAEMQKELASSQVSLLRIAENSSDMIYRYRFYPEKRFEYVNPAVVKLLGYTPEEFYANPDFNRVIVHPDDLPVLDYQDRLHDDFSATARYIAKDGRVVWLSHKPIPVWEDGRVVAVEGIARAVSEEKEREAALRAEIEERKSIERALIDIAEGVSAATGEEFFRSLVSHIVKTLDVKVAFIGVLSPDGKAARTIAAAERGAVIPNFDYELQGTPCGAVVASGLAFYADDVQKAFPRETFLREHAIASYMGTALRDSAGRTLGVLIVLDDKPLVKRTLAVSVLKVFAARAAAELERQSGADALRVSQERLRHALDAAGMGSWWWEIGTNRVMWDEVVHDLFGIPRGTFSGSFEHYMALIHPDDRAAVGAAIERAAGSNEPLVTEHRVIRNGEIAWLRGQGRMLFDAGGKPIGMFGICQDATTRKHVEGQLQDAKEHAESANRLKDALLASMSHELRSPLTAVLGFADLLSSQLKGTAHERYVSTIQKGGIRLLSILDGLLDYAQIETGRIVINPAAHPVRESAVHAAGMLRPAAEARGLTIEIEGGGDLYSFCDPLREEEVFIHLLENAVRFSARGVIRLAIAADRSGEKPMVAVSISDQGQGMSPAFVPHAFDEFRQEREADGRRAGSGLGLAIVKKLVERMGGDAHVRSVLGEGTTVTVRFPEAPRPEPAGAPAASGSTGHSVLVVEDDADCLNLLRDSLGATFEMTLCSRGEQAVAMAQERPFDLVLLDIHLGGIDGVETLRRLREIPGRGRMPVVALTGYALQGDPAKFLAAGFDAYHPKPFDPFELRNFLLRMLALTPASHS